MSRLGAVDASAATPVTLYAPAANKRATVKVLVTNRTGSVARVRVALRAAGGPTVDADYLSYDEAVGANEARRSTVFDMVNPNTLVVESDIAGVTFQANGLERDT